MSQVGLRITECRCLSLDDIKWEVGRFGKVLWSGRPNSIKLDELEVFCTVLDCGTEELLVREAESVATPAPTESETSEAIGQSSPVIRPRSPRGRSKPPL